MTRIEGFSTLFHAMKPSEAQVLGSTISDILFSHKSRDVQYTRLQTNEENSSLEDASIQITSERGSSCCRKLVFFLTAFLLLCAMVAAALYALGSTTYSVQVQMSAGDTLIYQFDHEMLITARKTTTRTISGRISFWVVNKTETECWFHTMFSPTQGEAVQPYLFVLKVHLEDKHQSESLNQNYKLFGEAKIDQELAYHIHCLFNQLLPVVKVKLYKAILSRVRDSYEEVIDTSSPFLPGRVKLHQSLSSTDKLVTISSRAGPQDFKSFFDNKHTKGQHPEVVWNLEYNETTVLSKETGMAVSSDMDLTARVPLGDASSRIIKNNLDTKTMTVLFHSKVKLLQERGKETEQKRFKHVKWIPLTLPASSNEPTLTYLAPKNKQSMALQELLRESALLSSKGPKSRFLKFPPLVELRHSSMEPYDEDPLEGDEDNPDDDNDDENEEDRQTLSPPTPLPSFVPFGFEDGRRKRRRALPEFVKGHPPAPTPARKNVLPNQKISASDLNAIWVELSSSPLSSYPKRTLRVLRTSLFGIDVFGEVEYQVKVEEEEEEEEDEEEEEEEEEEETREWSVMLSFYLDVGPYRFTTFKKIHRLKSIRRELLRKGKQPHVKHWKVKAGDLVSCAFILSAVRWLFALRV